MTMTVITEEMKKELFEMVKNEISRKEELENKLEKDPENKSLNINCVVQSERVSAMLKTLRVLELTEEFITN